MSEYILSCLVVRYTNYDKPLHLHKVKANSILITEIQLLVDTDSTEIQTSALCIQNICVRHERNFYNATIPIERAGYRNLCSN